MKFAVLDFETTGNQPADEIIQVGLVIIDDQLNIQNRYNSFVKPTLPVPPFITRLTGIEDSMLQNAPLLEDVLTEMIPLLEGTVLVGHHVAFDLGFLQRALEDNGYLPYTGKFLDTIDFVRMLYPMLTSYQLGSVSQALGIPLERPHQADCDAEATAAIWLRCIDKLNQLPLLTIQRLAEITEPLADDLFWFLHSVQQEKERQPLIEEDGFQYYRQFAFQASEWYDEEPARHQLDSNPFENVTFDEFYAEVKAQLKQQFERYEDRSAQEQMLTEVLESFEEEKHLLIEAGTGTGKSLGYLIPALYYGIRNDQKVIVSTHTINLQEQLRQRDIPLLKSIIPTEFRASVLKGRNHYLCLRKFEAKINLKDYSLLRDEILAAAQMIVWLGETESGDEEELHLGPKGNEFWVSVSSDADSCLNRACPWFKRCFYHRARHEANISDMIITNHSMLMTDVKADRRLLPSYDHLVIDEAHHLEEVASNHLGIHLQYFSIVHTLSRLLKDSRTGLLPLLSLTLARSADEKAEGRAVSVEELYPRLIAIKEHWDTLSELLYELLSDSSDKSTDTGQLVFRIRPDRLPDRWPAIRTTEKNINMELGAVIQPLEQLLLELKDEMDDYEQQSLLTDLSGLIKELTHHRESLRFFVNAERSDHVYWLEANSTYRSKSLQMYVVPADVSPQLREYFFDAKKSAILTSATLTVGKTFKYVSEQVGLAAAEENGKLRTVQLPSPFQYREQALVCIPRDFPSVRGADGGEQFMSTLVESLRDVALTMRGRTLVLFTSYRMLKQAYEPLKDQLTTHDIQVLGQGIDSGNRTKLTRLFQESKAAILLGTSSYWEGVDIPGDALSCLAIVRLPFQPPNHPLVEAKSELLEQQKLNPFMKLSVPQAVIRFKQGFGRLVRTSKDRGIVIIYDTRVIDTFYGKHFLYSLPGPKIEHMKLQHMVPRMKEWLERDS